MVLSLHSGRALAAGVLPRADSDRIIGIGRTAGNQQTGQARVGRSLQIVLRRAIAHYFILIAHTFKPAYIYKNSYARHKCSRTISKLELALFSAGVDP
jgi:hypothetical protein